VGKYRQKKNFQPAWRSIDLSDNQIGKISVIQLIKFLKNVPELVSLNLDNNPLGGDHYYSVMRHFNPEKLSSGVEFIFSLFTRKLSGSLFVIIF